ncbi:MAG: hypothetical protein LBQ98_10415 [Nitrososphaerota archaeon]|nr:hypothetical protein [Nitrososphaerota archaeon]
MEKLITKAKARGVHVVMVLLDRGFYTIDVIVKLKTLGVHFISQPLKTTP